MDSETCLDDTECASGSVPMLAVDSYSPTMKRRYRRLLLHEGKAAGQHLLEMLQRRPITRDAMLARRPVWRTRCIENVENREMVSGASPVTHETADLLRYPLQDAAQNVSEAMLSADAPTSSPSRSLIVGNVASALLTVISCCQPVVYEAGTCVSDVLVLEQALLNSAACPPFAVARTVAPRQGWTLADFLVCAVAVKTRLAPLHKRTAYPDAAGRICFHDEAVRSYSSRPPLAITPGFTDDGLLAIDDDWMQRLLDTIYAAAAHGSCGSMRMRLVCHARCRDH